MSNIPVARAVPDVEAGHHNPAHSGKYAPVYQAQPVTFHEGKRSQYGTYAYANASKDGCVQKMERSIRHAFIRKVYIILLMQLGVTLAGVSVSTFYSPVKAWLSQPAHFWIIFILSFVVSIMCIFVLMCCRELFPGNLIVLSVFTLAETALVSVICAKTESERAVFQAICITFIIFVSLTILACQTRFDFTNLGGAIFVLLMVLMWFVIFQLIFPINGKWYHYLIALLGSILFSLYILYDTSMIMKHYNPDEWVIAAISLYLDVINLFLCVLALTGGGGDK